MSLSKANERFGQPNRSNNILNQILKEINCEQNTNENTLIL